MFRGVECSILPPMVAGKVEDIHDQQGWDIMKNGQSAWSVGRGIRHILTIALAGLIVFWAGCSDSNPLAPFQPEIANNPDNFQFQVTAAKNVTTTVNYTWQNSGAAANTNQACSIQGGTATVTLFDANGTQVYTKGLEVNGTYPSTSGVAGAWTIRVVISGVSGSLNFRVQKL